jgi:hypothetical protein
MLTSGTRQFHVGVEDMAGEREEEPIKVGSHVRQLLIVCLNRDLCPESSTFFQFTAWPVSCALRFKCL